MDRRLKSRRAPNASRSMARVDPEGKIWTQNSFAKVAMVDGHERSVDCCVHLTRRMPVCSCSTLYCCTTAPTPQSHLSATTPPLTTPRARLLLCKQRVLLVAQHTCVAVCLQSTVQCELNCSGTLQCAVRLNERRVSYSTICTAGCANVSNVVFR